jgi:N-methylhydantoinase A
MTAPGILTDAAGRELWLSIDIGGTFTDIVAAGPEGVVGRWKGRSDATDEVGAIKVGLRGLLASLGIDGGDVSGVVHGTTMVTNAILERRGAPTGLLTTRGFRDVLEIRRLRMDDLYNLFWDKPPPLVERRHRREIAGRMDADGHEVESLSGADVIEAADVLQQAGVTSIAIGFMHSYANPEHELRAEALVRSRHPEVAVSRSSSVDPQYKEFERFSTTVANAYVAPVFEQYLLRLDDALDGLGIEVNALVMQSDGGVTATAEASAKPVRCIESGPAAGVVGAVAIAEQLGLSDRSLLTLDMGGTTTKASLIADGRLTTASELDIGGQASAASQLLRGAGYVVRTEVIDLAEVGAGGGSLVSIDEAGALHVGPESAGAWPGPVCYGLGGDIPTLTDANLLLGYVNPGELAGGDIRVDFERAERTFTESVAEPLGLELGAAAYGVYAIATAHMVQAIRSVSVERGADPRGAVMVAFGGAGPTHAAAAAAELGIERIVVPPIPGLFSAFGMLAADASHSVLASVNALLESFEIEALARTVAELEAETSRWFSAMSFAADGVRLTTTYAMRYAGQSYELAIELTEAPPVPARSALRDAFEAEHRRLYGHALADGPVELVAVRVTGRIARPSPPLRGATDGRAADGAGGTREAYFGPRWGMQSTRLVARDDLRRGAREGPLILDEYDSTIVVPPGWSARSDDDGVLILDAIAGGDTP